MVIKCSYSRLLPPLVSHLQSIAGIPNFILAIYIVAHTRSSPTNIENATPCTNSVCRGEFVCKVVYCTPYENFTLFYIMYMAQSTLHCGSLNRVEDPAWFHCVHYFYHRFGDSHLQEPSYPRFSHCLILAAARHTMKIEWHNSFSTYLIFSTEHHHQKFSDYKNFQIYTIHNAHVHILVDINWLKSSH